MALFLIIAFLSPHCSAAMEPPVLTSCEMLEGSGTRFENRYRFSLSRDSKGSYSLHYTSIYKGGWETHEIHNQLLASKMDCVFSDAEHSLLRCEFEEIVPSESSSRGPNAGSVKHKFEVFEQATTHMEGEKVVSHRERIVEYTRAFRGVVGVPFDLPAKIRGHDGGIHFSKGRISISGAGERCFR